VNENNTIWFAEEIGMWIITPILGIILTLISHHCVKKRIL
jgi:hypothetical protein